MGSDTGVVDERVTIAMNASLTTKLSIHQFVTATEFKIDPIMVNYFWQVVTKSHSPHMRTMVLKFIGYDSTDDRKNKHNFIQFLKRQAIPYEELLHNDERCKLYDDIVEEQRTMEPKDLAKRKWLIMNSRDFKRAIMGLRTKQADAIKDYYFNLEELVQLYCDYDKRFELRKRNEVIGVRDDKIEELTKLIIDNKRSTDEILMANKRSSDEMLNAMKLENKRATEDNKRAIDELLDINHDQLDQLNSLTTQNNDLQQDVTAIGRKLNVACVDRAPRPLRPSKQERFVVLKWANLNYHRNLTNPKPYDNHRVYGYYAVRAQAPSVVSALRDQRQKDAALEIVLDINVQPNTKTLYNRIKDELANQGVVFLGNYISLTNAVDLSETEFIERMREVNDDKYNVL